MSKKKKGSQDPYAEREAAKYPNPIHSREFILNFLEQVGKPLDYDAIACALAITDEEQLEALRRRLRAMERDGQLMRTRQGGYALVSKLQLLKGRVIGHREGYGFLQPDEGGDDLYLHVREMRTVLDGDRVLVRVANVNQAGRREAEVVEVLQRGTKTLVGRYYQESGMGLLKPHNSRIGQDVLIPPGQEGNAQPSQIVVAEIIAYPSRRYPTMAKVVEILGDQLDPGMEIELALRAHDLPHVWSPQLLAQAEKFSKEVTEAEKKQKGRKDIRHLPLVTIDGEDAKDFDDAVYCEKGQRSYKLWVAIADVSHYVQPETPLDAEAEIRGNSVYFPRQVIPMLPEVLSNELCSLKPKVDRLCMVCEIEISMSGKILGYQFYSAVMYSHARLTYNNVQKILDGDAATIKQYATLLEPIRRLHELYGVLHKARQKRGALDFNTVETQFIFNEQLHIKSIIPRTRLESHRLIEECMLAANVCAAQFLQQHKIPALYRVHSGPNADKLPALRAFLQEFKLRLGGGDNPRPKDYALLIQEIQNLPEQQMLQTVLLRSLTQAVYSTQNSGHFGLAYDAYAHFTSPIRRYPDLLVHRCIRHLLQGGNSENFIYTELKVQQFADQCSYTERRADQAHWDVVAVLKCQFMQQRVGETFHGLITSVTNFGFFVELEQVYVEGLVHISTLESDYYRFEAFKHSLVGERTRRVYRIGDAVEVRLVKVDLDERKIDLVVLQESKAQTENSGHSRNNPGKGKHREPKKGESSKPGKRKPKFSGRNKRHTRSKAKNRNGT